MRRNNEELSAPTSNRASRRLASAGFALLVALSFLGSSSAFAGDFEKDSSDKSFFERFFSDPDDLCSITGVIVNIVTDGKGRAVEITYETEDGSQLTLQFEEPINAAETERLFDAKENGDVVTTYYSVDSDGGMHYEYTNYGTPRKS